MSRLFWVMGWLLLSSTAAAAPTRVEVVGPRVGPNLDPARTAGLRRQLINDLVQTRRYRVVPSKAERRRIIRKKVEAYRPEMDADTRPTFGGEAAAVALVELEVGRLGEACEVRLSLIDLRRALTVRAASAQAECGRRSLRRAVRRAAFRLAGQPLPPDQVQRRKRERAAVVRRLGRRYAGVQFDLSSCVLELSSARCRASVDLRDRFFESRFENLATRVRLRLTPVQGGCAEEGFDLEVPPREADRLRAFSRSLSRLASACRSGD